MKPKLDPSARTGRFSARFAFHDEPEVLDRLEYVAAEMATSAATIVRMALRQFLDQIDKHPETRVG